MKGVERNVSNLGSRV